MQQAAVADLHKASGQAMREAPADTGNGGERGGAWACPAGLTVGEGDGAVLEAHEAAVGKSDFADLGGEVCQGGVAVGMGLAVDVPGDGPALGGELLQQTGLAHVFLKESTVAGGEGFDGDKEGGSGRPPGGALLRPSTAGHEGGNGGVVRELSAPGGQATGKAGEGGTDAALLVSEAFAGRGRGLEHGLGSAVLRRADEGSAGRRDGAGEEDMRPGKLCVQGVGSPLRGFRMLTLGTVAVATGMLDVVVPPQFWHGERRWPSWPLWHCGMARRTWRCEGGRGGERSRDAGAKAVKLSRRVVMAGALAGERGCARRPLHGLGG